MANCSVWAHSNYVQSKKLLFKRNLHNKFQTWVTCWSVARTSTTYMKWVVKLHVASWNRMQISLFLVIAGHLDYFKKFYSTAQTRLRSLMLPQHICNIWSKPYTDYGVFSCLLLLGFKWFWMRKSLNVVVFGKGEIGIRWFWNKEDLNEEVLEWAGFDNKLQQKVKHRNRKMGLKVVDYRSA